MLLFNIFLSLTLILTIQCENGTLSNNNNYYYYYHIVNYNTLIKEIRKLFYLL